MSDGQREERAGIARMRGAGFFPLAFVALAVLALAVLPSVMSRRINDVTAEIEDVLEPARRLGQDLTVAQARQMARFQSYLLTGDTRFAQRYQMLIAEEQDKYRELLRLVDRANLQVREQIAALSSASQTWHAVHMSDGGPLEDDEGRLAYLELMSGELARYEAVLGASAALEQALADQVDAARNRMEEARESQVYLSIALAALALAATLGVGVIGRRLGELVSESEGRRADALRARREMQAVLEASADGVVGIDLTGRCTSLNGTGSKLLGMTEHDARERGIHELLHGKAPAEAAHEPTECPLLQALDAGVEREFPDSVVWRRDGTSFPAGLHLRPLVDGWDVRGGVLTIIDMTEVREAEDALRRAVQARDEMVAIVSHDLRNPLGTVAAAADLLIDLPLPPEKREEQIGIIRRAAARMSRLIEDLLDVACIEAGVLRVALGSVEVQPFVDETMALFANQAAEGGLLLESSIDEPLPPMRADRARMEQVLSNLLGNAVKFTPPGGRVGVAASAVDGRVRLSVSDTGSGIPSAVLENLFDRFWKFESGGRRGTGLGLTIVRGIVEAHGGTVEVESEVGAGSTFHVEIPAVQEPEEGREGTA